MAKVDKRFNNGRTNYNRSNKSRIRFHELTPEEHNKMMEDYLKENTIKVVDYSGDIIEEKKEL